MENRSYAHSIIKMRLTSFFARISKYEYWPMWVFYMPIFPYYLYLAMKYRSWAFFSAANPGIYLGGFFGESKEEIMKLIPSNYLPQTVFIDPNLPEEKLKLETFTFPLIVKPDVGERGTGVMKIESMDEYLMYFSKQTEIFLVQEYVTYPIELGVLYSRLPNETKGKVSSITGKEFLTVIGDGTSSVLQLMKQTVRARFQIRRFQQERSESYLNHVLNKGEALILEPIGNHCRGTRFINRNDLIEDKLNVVFDAICLPIDGFFFGRFDLKVTSEEDLIKGLNIKIMELNGVSSEPGHVYDVDFSIWKAYSSIIWHWKRLAEIAFINKTNGFKTASFKEILRAWKI